MFDGRLRELLESGDEREWNGQTIERTGPEQEQALLLYLRLRLLFVFHARLFTQFAKHAGTLADAEHVEDEGHAAITHNRRAGVQESALSIACPEA
jgi:hypothetical protein